MRFLRFLGYFAKLRSLIGLGGACRFATEYLWVVISPPRDGALASLPVGPYRFYFPSLSFFFSLFTEIFFKETYYLAQTTAPIQVIDCGANIGVSLLYIKLRAPLARVTCFEPNPAARKVLEKNIEANGWRDDVRVLPYALGNKKGTLNFFVDEREATSSGGSLGAHTKSKNQKLASYPVEVDLLSSYIDRRIDLLKIDIEGAEFDVLDEASRAGKLDLVSSIQLEYHYVPGFFTKPLSEFLALLESKGFKTFVESNTPPTRIVGKDIWHTYMIFAWR